MQSYWLGTLMRDILPFTFTAEALTIRLTMSTSLGMPILLCSPSQRFAPSDSGTWTIWAVDIASVAIPAKKHQRGAARATERTVTLVLSFACQLEYAKRLDKKL